jgi:hypothetical protein
MEINLLHLKGCYIVEKEIKVNETLVKVEETTDKTTIVQLRQKILALI